MLEWLQSIGQPASLATISVVCGVLTEMIIRVTPAGFDRKRFAPPISALLGVGVALLIGPRSVDAGIMGLLAGWTAGGGVSQIKSIRAIVGGSNAE